MSDETKTDLLTEAIALFEDAEIVLEEFYACDDENCIEPNCLHVRQRIKTFLSKVSDKGEQQ